MRETSSDASSRDWISPPILHPARNPRELPMRGPATIPSPSSASRVASPVLQRQCSSFVATLFQ